MPPAMQIGTCRLRTFACQSMVGSSPLSRPIPLPATSGRSLAWHLLRGRGQLAVEGEKRRAAAKLSPLPMPKPLVPTPTNPSQWRRMRVIWPFVTVVALMLLLGHASLQVLSGMRAFANAESARSKSLAVAVSDLERYAETRNESAYGRFLAGMATGSALRDARAEFAKARPDIDVAKQRLRDARI